MYIRTNNAYSLEQHSSCMYIHVANENRCGIEATPQHAGMARYSMQEWLNTV